MEKSPNTIPRIVASHQIQYGMHFDNLRCIIFADNKYVCPHCTADTFVQYLFTDSQQSDECYVNIYNKAG